MATTTRKRVVRRHNVTMKMHYNVPVNVKVRGERTMRKNVILVKRQGELAVSVLTGRRGRPAKIALSDIEKIRAL